MKSACTQNEIDSASSSSSSSRRRRRRRRACVRGTHLWKRPTPKTPRNATKPPNTHHHHQGHHQGHHHTSTRRPPPPHKHPTQPLQSTTYHVERRMSAITEPTKKRKGRGRRRHKQCAEPGSPPPGLLPRLSSPRPTVPVDLRAGLPPS